VIIKQEQPKRLRKSDGGISSDDMELLARLEYDRWVGERLAEGWSFGKETDKKNKTSCFLATYESLAEEIKQYDRMQVVSQLVNLLDN